MSTSTLSHVPVGRSGRGVSGVQRAHRGRYRDRNRDTRPPDALNSTSNPMATAASPALALRPATLPPLPQVEAHGQEAPATRAFGHIGRKRRGGRSARAGRAGSQFIGGPGRSFQGQLTTGTHFPDQVSPATLQADAPTFTPGQPLALRDSSGSHSQTRLRRASKSSAPDLATRTHDDILNGLYECPICTNEILRNSKIWSCKTCWSVFHLSCINRWSKNHGSTQQPQQEAGELPPPRQWRCPGCNLPKDDLPTSYTCWCSKEIDPKPIPGIPPHSCGQTCSKPRAPRKCPHPCELLCHAGPCPPCPHLGPSLACFCGKDSVSKRCLDTDYNSGWSCGKICGDLMPCNEHTCGRPCHEGLCGSCEILVDSRCYCGKVEKALSCSCRSEERESRVFTNAVSQQYAETGQNIETWTGSFDCGSLCNRLFDCNKHSCQKTCHEQTFHSHCPFSPDVVTYCPCGKTLLTELNCHRTSCQDPIPRCQKTCLKTLPCGHLCQEKCHDGNCRPCLETVTIKCRCGRTSSSTMCHQGTEESPHCSKICKSQLNCGRHECGERCCSAERLAGERQATRRKMRTRNLDENFEAEHICTRTCGKPLKCGNSEHVCQELCHRGPCGSCREAIFDEIACHCGRTVLQPPLPCGTQPPACQYQCDRPNSCGYGHPQVQHQCHIDGACPKCPYLVEKSCMCGKNRLKNQPCWLASVTCGQTCGRRLKCGIHSCKKLCHRLGECEDSESRTCPHHCGQRKTAPDCGHLCLDPCHAPYPCKEDKPCQAKIIITCECQHLKQEIKCLAMKSTESNPQRRSLKCDDECLRLQRNQKLAMALNISSDHMDGHIPYSTGTLDKFRENVNWSQAQERGFRVFAADEAEKRLRFKPMSAQQRAFLHALAEDFGLDSESMDPEPHRHVVIFKSPRFVSAPMKTIAQCIKLQAAVQPSTSVTAPLGPADPYNALILSSPRFALTADELRASLQSSLSSIDIASINISFLPSEEIVLYGSQNTGDLSEPTLKRSKPVVEKVVLAEKLAASVALCRIDHSLNVIRREDNSTTRGGWSQVVKGMPFKAVSQGSTVGTKSAFTVLGTKSTISRKMPKQTEGVVEDWESAVDGWE